LLYWESYDSFRCSVLELVGIFKFLLQSWLVTVVGYSGWLQWLVTVVAQWLHGGCMVVAQWLHSGCSGFSFTVVMAAMVIKKSEV
jgi:hypothetical protein